MSSEGLMVFTGNANPKLAEAVVKHLGIPLGKALVGRFSDGEVQVEIQENVRGKHVFILQSTCTPANDSLMEVLLMADALKEGLAKMGKVNNLTIGPDAMQMIAGTARSMGLQVTE